MDKKYIIGIDQSTQGTKALLFDGEGHLLRRTDLPHRQIINEKGWVSHDLNEIYSNTVQTVKTLVTEAKIQPEEVAGIGISNQRETTASWDRKTGEPLEYAIVWQCGRASGIAQEIAEKGCAEEIREATGLQLSAYFPAAKMAWLLRNGGEERQNRAKNGELCLGTIDSWLIYKLTGGAFKTDYSNASRTQLFNLKMLSWDEKICGIFDIPVCALAEVCDSDAVYGMTTMEGLFANPVPICGVLGDSHAALFAQHCHSPGQLKVTYGTGSSAMMNTGAEIVRSSNGLASSVAWSFRGKTDYVLEGNINYSGAVISWLKNDLKLINTSEETEKLALKANRSDKTYLVPAFSGLGAPYWFDDAKASITGMTRLTGKAEIVRAALDSIAYQINDILSAMSKDSKIPIRHISVDGGPTNNRYLMQFQSDISMAVIRVSEVSELSGMGVGFMAGISAGLFTEDEAFSTLEYISYAPKMSDKERCSLINGWRCAIETLIGK